MYALLVLGIFMKLLHITRENIFGGGEQQILRLFRNLQKKEFEQIIVCLENSPMHKICQENSYRHATIKYRHNFSILNAWQLYKIALNFSPDLINVHDYKSHNHMFMANLLFFKKFNYIITRRVVFNVRKTVLNNFKYNNRWLKKIICVSDAAKESLKSILHDSNMAEVIYEGIDIKKYIVNNKKISNSLNIVNVGRLSAEKNQICFIDIADILIDNYKLEANFIIAGSGNEHDNLQRYINSKGLSNRVKLMGFISNMSEFLSKADILIVTSLYESFGLSIVEAMGAKVAIIATNVGGIPEICEHGDNAFLFSSNSPQEAAVYVKKLIDDPVLMKNITKKGFEKAKFFDVNSMISKTIKIYEQIVCY